MRLETNNCRFIIRDLPEEFKLFERCDAKWFEGYIAGLTAMRTDRMQFIAEELLKEIDAILYGDYNVR